MKTMRDHTNTSIYNRLVKGARNVHAALPRMHLLFNVLRTLLFVVILAWSVIVLAIAIHFQLVLVSSELTRFIPLALFAGAFTIVVIVTLLVLSNLRKTPNPVSTRTELLCLAAIGTSWLALGLLTATSPSQDADVECFSDTDESLEVTNFTTDTFQAQYRVIEAFSLFNAILSWGYFLTLLVLALRHHHLGWKRVWSTPATSSPFYDTPRRGSQKHAHRSGGLPVPVTARVMATVAASRGTHRVAAAPAPARRQSPRHSSPHGHPPRAKSPRHHSPRQQAGGKKYVVYVPEVRGPPEAHPRTHHRTTSPRGRS